MTRIAIGQLLAAADAATNGLSTVLLLVGRVAIGRRWVGIHRAAMVSAFCTSCAFLASYMLRMAMTGVHRDIHRGWLHRAYIILLASHLVLATLVAPLVIVTLVLAFRGRVQAHRRLARWTFPVWLYVSVTGIVVYFVLYHLPA
jgi:putative membrane protein